MVPVAGRIDAQPSPLMLSVESWLSALAGRGKKPNTIKAYRTFVTSAARENGWTRPEDLTYEAVVTWMGGKRAAGIWQGTTYSRNLTVLRSLTNHLRKTKRVAEDTLADADRAEDDGGQGSRAASTDEARAMVRRAWAVEQGDRRRSAEVALQRMCMFLAACRAGEPGQWRWKHLRLDDPVPHVAWTKDIQKNRRDQDVALAPELARLLRAHRDARRGAAPVVTIGRREGTRTVRPVDSQLPEAFVFAQVSTRTTWRADRDKVGIPAEDHRGRKFSPHSSRKWFETSLIKLGVPDRFVDQLMRHSGDVGSRYLDPTLEEQAEVVSKLPRLWPVDEPPSYPQGKNPRGIDLTTGAGAANLSTLIRGIPRAQDNPALVPSPAQSLDKPDRKVCHTPGGGTIVGITLEHLRQAIEKVGGVEAIEYQGGNADFRTHKPVDSTQDELADLFQSLATVLRRGAPRVSQQPVRRDVDRPV